MSTATTTNADTVAAIYDAFARGDLLTILDSLAESVAWERWRDNSAQRAGVAHLRERTGPAQVVEFFQIVGGWTTHTFEVLDIVGSGRQVVVEVVAEFSLPGGGRYLDEELHLWTFDDAGRVTRLRHYVDTVKHIAAARGEDTTAR